MTKGAAWEEWSDRIRYFSRLSFGMCDWSWLTRGVLQFNRQGVEDRAMRCV